MTSGGLIGVLTPCCATARGYRLRRTAQGQASALEEGVWGRNLLKVSPQLAQPQRLKMRHPIKPMNARNQGSHQAATETGQN